MCQEDLELIFILKNAVLFFSLLPKYFVGRAPGVEIESCLTYVKLSVQQILYDNECRLIPL